MDKKVQPSGGAIPKNIQKKRMQKARYVARPAYASLEVELVTVRHQHGYQTGVGIKGAKVAAKKMTLVEAQKLLEKIVNRWGRLITKKIPNIGLDPIDENSDNFDLFDYNAVDRRSATYSIEPVQVETMKAPAPGTSLRSEVKM